ncbi:MAG: MerR family transcriptional regulator [Actinomycetota bacterium]|nr:MerR family transcriptional regulator [Actinomycetota bacterium]
MFRVSGYSAGWTVGELARATRLSARVLRHWDELGVVSPGRTPSGHRCYAREDVTRLYHAVALRQLGLGLTEIAALLAANNPDPQAALRGHLAAVEHDLRHLRDLRDRLVQVLDVLERRGGQAGADDNLELLLGVIKKMTTFE